MGRVMFKTQQGRTLVAEEDGLTLEKFTHELRRSFAVSGYEVGDVNRQEIVASRRHVVEWWAVDEAEAA